MVFAQLELKLGIMDLAPNINLSFSAFNQFAEKIGLERARVVRTGGEIDSTSIIDLIKNAAEQKLDTESFSKLNELLQKYSRVKEIKDILSRSRDEESPLLEEFRQILESVTPADSDFMMEVMGLLEP